MLWKSELCERSDTKPEEGGAKAGGKAGPREDRSCALLRFLRTYSVPEAGETQRVSPGLLWGRSQFECVEHMQSVSGNFSSPPTSSTHFLDLVTPAYFLSQASSLSETILLVYLVTCSLLFPPTGG